MDYIKTVTFEQLPGKASKGKMSFRGLLVLRCNIFALWPRIYASSEKYVDHSYSKIL